MSSSRITAADFLAIVSGRRGHFQLESGHHGGLWLDLDNLFADPVRVQPFVNALADQLKPHAPAMVCGPLLGGAFVAQLVARELSAGFCFTERKAPPRADGLYQARYELPRAFRDAVRGKRIAIVDDVMSAGSALRGTCFELANYQAVPVVAGALLVLGTAGRDYFRDNGVAVVSVASDDYQLWTPDACPLCAKGVPLELPGS